MTARPSQTLDENVIQFIDLFCGIGGFRYAAQQAAREANIAAQAIFASDIDVACQDSYEANFGHRPMGDITRIDEADIPNHNLLLGGFPCQAFSIMGDGKGFGDTRGTLFFHIARVLAEKQPTAFVLENVKQLVGHNQGKTLKRILKILRQLDYTVEYRVLNALDFGLPQKRERVWIVGRLGEHPPFVWPEGNVPMTPLDVILETQVNKKHFASKQIVKNRLMSMSGKQKPVPSIWHENKSGNISALPYSCALRAGASYNYLLVNGRRRLTPRELLRLQGFPEEFRCVVSDSAIRKQAGNSLPVNVAYAVLRNLMPLYET